MAGTSLRPTLTAPADGVSIDLVTAGYRTGAALARHVPAPITDAAVAVGSKGAVWLTPARRLVLRRHLERAAGRPLGEREAWRKVQQAYGAYARYWVESFRLPTLSEAEIDAGMSYHGYEHLVRAVAAGPPGPIMVMPHLGGWEWAGFWMTRLMDLPVTVVVEALEPPELYDFFLSFRRSLGMNIITLGPDAGREVLTAIRRGDVVGLLSDRDIDGTGVPVEFFGEQTTLPAGPATLALRTGAPLLSVGAYFDGKGHRCIIRPPLTVERQGKLREDIRRVTRDVAAELEELIRVAPEQWHLLQPNWPSDHEALAAAGVGS